MNASFLLSRHRGVTLIEAMVVITLLAILGAIGVPSFMGTMDRARINGATDNLLTNIRLVQAEAVKTNQNTTITFTPGANWSYSTSNTTPAVVVSSAEYRGTTLTAGTQLVATSNILTFEPRRNSVTPRAAAGAAPITLLTIQSNGGHSVSVTVTSNSDITACTSTSLGGYPAC
jgi:prepilin-type N-terminal cleavage/methylation domain-containing protein